MLPYVIIIFFIVISVDSLTNRYYTTIQKVKQLLSGVLIYLAGIALLYGFFFFMARVSGTKAMSSSDDFIISLIQGVIISGSGVTAILLSRRYATNDKS
jgi:nitrate reductase gamma subunit